MRGKACTLCPLWLAIVAVGLSAVAGAQPAVIITPPPATVDARVGIIFDIQDDISRLFNATASFSVDGGAVFTHASEGPGSGGLEALTSAPDGEAHVFVWDALGDLGTVQEDSVQFRIQLAEADSVTAAATATTADFSVDLRSLPTTITGTTANNANGVPIGGVQVEAHSVAGGTLVDSTQTDSSGEYTLDLGALDVTVAVTFSATGYKTLVINNLAAPLYLPVRLTLAPPGAPTGLTAYAAADEAQLRWRGARAENLAGYHVYRSADGGPWELLTTSGPAPNTVYEDKAIAIPTVQDPDKDEDEGEGPQPVQTASYYVTAVDALGHESEPSEVAVADATAFRVNMPDQDVTVGGEVRIPVNVANLSGICPAGVDIELLFDANTFAAGRVERTGANPQIAYFTNIDYDPGLVAGGLLDLAALLSADCRDDALTSEGHFINFFFTLDPNIPVGTEIPFEFQKVKFVDGYGIALETDFSDTATVRVVGDGGGNCLLGDLNGDGEVTAADARIVLDIAVGRIEPTDCQRQAGDLNGDQRLDSADATMILRLAEGEPINPAEKTSAAQENPDNVTVAIADVTGVDAGATAQVPISAETSDGLPLNISGFEIKVSYRAARSNLVFQGVEAGDITTGFTFNARAEQGAVTISAIAKENIAESSGVLAMLVFKLAPNAPQEAVLPLTITSTEFKQQYGESLQWTSGTTAKDGSLITSKVALPGALAVSVRTANSDLPIAEATVRAGIAGGLSGATELTTNGEGIAVFQPLPTANFFLEAQKPGYNSGRGGPVWVSAGATANRVIYLTTVNIEASHCADQDASGHIDLGELLRVIQLFNTGGYHCADLPESAEDGYNAGPGSNDGCPPHDSDYRPQDWRIDLSELLRLIQFFNTGGYYPCPEDGTEDGFCPGLP